MIILIAIVLCELILGALLGHKFSVSYRASKKKLVILFVAYILLATTLAYIATLFPGPGSRYEHNSPADYVRRFLTGPSSLLWIIGPIISAAFVSAWQQSNIRQEHPRINIEQLGFSAAVSLLFLPL